MVSFCGGDKDEEFEGDCPSRTTKRKLAGLMVSSCIALYWFIKLKKLKVKNTRRWLHSAQFSIVFRLRVLFRFSLLRENFDVKLQRNWPVRALAIDAEGLGFDSLTGRIGRDVPTARHRRYTSS